MSSDRCEELLVGLVSGDLGEEQERAARAEIGRCAAHAGELRRIDVGMRLAALFPSVDPRPELDDAILAAARAKVSTPKPSGPEKPAEDGFFARALAVLRRMAAGPQLAMSTVMLLVVAIGLWYLPARHDPDAAGDTVLAPQVAQDVRDEAAPAPSAAEPARRDEERVAQAPHVVGGPSGPKPRPTSPQELAPAPPVTRTPAQRTAAARSTGRQRRMSGASREGAAMEEASRESEGFGALALGDDTRARGAGRASGAANAFDTPAAASSSPAAAAPAAPAARAQAPEPERAVAAGAAVDGRPDAASAYQRGMEAYRAGRYVEAADLFSAAAQSGPQAASALHYLARSRRAGGQCAIAVRDYERLLGGFPAYGQRTQAMVEAADCYQRTGHLAAAERWLERAAQTSPGSVTAQRELTRVRARRAAGEARAAETEPAAPRETAPAAAEAESD